MPASIRLVEPADNEFLAGLEGKAKQPSLFFRAMANRPEVLQSFVPLYSSIMGRGPVDRRTKELVYLTCAFANHCAYCSASHTAGGRKAGVSEEEMAALRAGQDEAFSAPERAAIGYARELTRTANANESRAALRQHFDDAQVVEITLVAALANFTNRFNNGLQVLPE